MRTRIISLRQTRGSDDVLDDCLLSPSLCAIGTYYPPSYADVLLAVLGRTPLMTSFRAPIIVNGTRSCNSACAMDLQTHRGLDVEKNRRIRVEISYVIQIRR